MASYSSEKTHHCCEKPVPRGPEWRTRGRSLRSIFIIRCSRVKQVLATKRRCGYCGYLNRKQGSNSHPYHRWTEFDTQKDEKPFTFIFYLSNMSHGPFLSNRRTQQERTCSQWRNRDIKLLKKFWWKGHQHIVNFLKENSWMPVREITVQWPKNTATLVTPLTGALKWANYTQWLHVMAKSGGNEEEHSYWLLPLQRRINSITAYDRLKERDLKSGTRGTCLCSYPQKLKTT